MGEKKVKVEQFKLSGGLKAYAILVLVTAIVILGTGAVGMAIGMFAPEDPSGDIDENSTAGKIYFSTFAFCTCMSPVLVPLVLILAITYTIQKKRWKKRMDMEEDRIKAETERKKLENRKKKADLAKQEADTLAKKLKLGEKKEKSKKAKAKMEKEDKEDDHQRDLLTYRDALKHSITNDGLVDPSEEGVLQQLRESMGISQKEHDEILMHILEGEK